MTARRGARALLPIVAWLLPGVLRRLRLADHQQIERPEFGVPLSILDDVPNVRPTLHCFVASKAPWFDMTDTLPQFPELPDSY
jgi:hypothetical protein